MDVLNHLCILWPREQSHCKIHWQHAKIKSECIGKERTFLGAVREGGGVTLNYKSIKRHLSPWPGQICKVYLWTSVIYVNFLQNSLENIFGNNTVYWNLSVLALYSFVEKVFQSPLLWRWKSHKVRSIPCLSWACVWRSYEWRLGQCAFWYLSCNCPLLKPI